jgi:dipeptidyl aminopeptidase/acylaminoacyl peptidase
MLPSDLIGRVPAVIPDKANAASPMSYVSAKSAPFFIVHGDHDMLVPLQQSIKLNAALKNAGVQSDLYVVPGGAHGTRSDRHPESG